MSRGRLTGRQPPTWSDDYDALLVRLWSEGELSVRAIAAEMSRQTRYAFTKNQVIGRAHRLVANGRIKSKGNPVADGRIKSKGSPVAGPRSGARAVEAARAKTVRAFGPDSLPRQPSGAWSATDGRLHGPSGRNNYASHKGQLGNIDGLDVHVGILQRLSGMRDARAIDEATASMQATFTPRLRAPERCCWPLDKIGPGKGWEFCKELSEPGKVYCAEHRQRAYVFKVAPAAPAAENTA